MNYAPPQRRNAGVAPAAKAAPSTVKIGPVADSFEMEAEQVAASAMGSAGFRPPWSISRSDPPTLRRCACGGKSSGGGECDECKKKKEQEVQRDPSGPSSSSYAPPIVHQVLNSPGERLAASTQKLFERRFNFDFSGVRVHTGRRAAESAAAVNANAYTVGNHLVFGEDKYAPHSSAGQRLLAHELAHTIQQGSAPPQQTQLRIGAEHDVFERQAQSAASRVSSGAEVSSPFSLTRPVIQRDTPDYSKLSIDQLRKLISKGDKGAIDVLYQRYAAMSNAELETFARSGKDAIANSIYASRIVPAKEAAGQGNFSKPGMQDSLAKDIAQERTNSGIVRRAPNPAMPDIETQGGTVGSARTDIPGLENRTFLGRSPQAGGQVNPNSNFPPATDPSKLPHTHGHAEQNIADQLEEALAKIPREQLKGRRIWMLIEQEPCSTCAQGASNVETAAGVLKKLSLKYPELIIEVKSLESSSLIVLKGVEGGAADASKGAPAAPEGEAQTQVQVKTLIEVTKSVKNADGTVVSEVELTLSQHLEEINSGAPAAGKLPAKIVMRITQNADGTIAAVESLSGHPQALVEALAQKALGAEAGAVEGVAEGAAVAGARRMALLFKGLKFGGWAAFTIITGYQLYNATPKQRPRVLASAAGGLAAGAGASYLVCNLIFGIETAGWSLLFCGLAVGGAAGYGGSKATEAAYDAATATPLDEAIHTLEGKGKNPMILFNILVNKMQSDGCIDEGFVNSFMSALPPGLTDTESILLAAQLADAPVAKMPPMPKVKTPAPVAPGPGERTTECPSCHGRSTKEVLRGQLQMTPEEIEQLKNLPSCASILAGALNTFRNAVKNLPPRPTATQPILPKPAPRQPGPNEHPTPPGVVIPPPQSKEFPTEKEQIGTVCPNCHRSNGESRGNDLWKQFPGGFGSGPKGELTPEDQKKLMEWLDSQKK